MNFTRTYDSPAKINLGLKVPFRYKSGYHHIVSLFLRIDLKDVMEISINESNLQKFNLTWENCLPKGFDSEKTTSVFTDNIEKNLIFKANNWILEFLGRHSVNLPPLSISVHIVKRIPSPGGLGGGSSNAAIILQAYMDFIRERVTPGVFKFLSRELSREGLLLGSDIPFFLQDHNALISGTGEVFKQYGNLHICGILGIPSFGFSTAEMYGAMNKPQCFLDRENILSFLQTSSKNSLQPDKSFLYNLLSLHDKFQHLYDGINKEIVEDFSPLCGENSETDLLSQKENRTFFVKNDFIEVTKKLFPDKFFILEKIEDLALERLHIAASVLKSPVFLTSMSGSGSTMYAGVVLKDHDEENLRKRLCVEIESLRRKYPETYWVEFCSIK